MSSIHDQIIAAEAERQKAQAKIDRLKKIEEVLQDPESEAVIRKALGMIAEAQIDRVTVSPGITAFDRLKVWFAEQGNSPATIADMAKVAGVSVSAIRQVVYRSRAADFTNVGRGATRETLFRIKNADDPKGSVE